MNYNKNIYLPTRNVSSVRYNRTTDEDAIRKLVEDWARAVRAKDLKGILANHSPEMLMFDVPPPLESKGEEKIKFEFRLTIGLRKMGGQWIVMHEHHSIPAS